MPDPVMVVKPRKIFYEDLAVGTGAAGTEETEVLEAGVVELTYLLKSAADDASAEAIGVPSRGVYWNTTHSSMVARAT